MPQRKKITIPWVRSRAGKARESMAGKAREPMPGKARRLVMVTAYDAGQARLVDSAGVDLVLVGDSVAMVVLGHDDTLSVTMDEMMHHVRAVRRGLETSLLIADMPYGSFHLGSDHAVSNALRFVKEGGAEAVKVEGPRSDVVKALADAEIPVMAHLGLTPQSVHRLGGYKVQGRGEDAAAALRQAAHELEEAGAFALVLECVPATLAAAITEEIGIPTIGIGAGPGCTGQVLVYHDLLGLEERIAPRFVRRYAELGSSVREAIATYAEDVRSGRFPGADESYGDPTAGAEALGRLYG